jgi:hypothetical protein
MKKLTVSNIGKKAEFFSNHYKMVIGGIIVEENKTSVVIEIPMSKIVEYNNKIQGNNVVRIKNTYLEQKTTRITKKLSQVTIIEGNGNNERLNKKTFIIDKMTMDKFFYENKIDALVIDIKDTLYFYCKEEYCDKIKELASFPARIKLEYIPVDRIKKTNPFLYVLTLRFLNFRSIYRVR